MKLSKIIKPVFTCLGGEAIFRMLNSTPRVLFWHGVDVANDIQIEAESFRLDVFERQIKYLNCYYEIISIEDFCKRMKANNFSGKEIVLTFDDGYRNNLTVVAPLLKAMKLPYTVFISTEHIQTGELYPTSIIRLMTLSGIVSELKVRTMNSVFDISTPQLGKEVNRSISAFIKSAPVETVRMICKDLIGNISEDVWSNLKNRYPSVLPMSWDEVRELYQMGATIGSHCRYHICCHGNQNQSVVKEQIMESKADIERELCIECQYFAYPNGDHTAFADECVKEAGYIAGFSTERNGRYSLKKLNYSALPRISVVSNISTFKVIVNYFPKKI